MSSSKIDAAEAVDTQSSENLSNVVWASLSEAPEEFVERFKDGAMYRSEFAPFGAARDYSAECVAHIGAMLQPEQKIILFSTSKPEIPSGYDVVLEATGYQMIAEKDFTQPTDVRISRLGAEDVPDMSTLAELTKPGPFSSRTIELGNFFGIREDGKLVAMAGERLAAGNYVEVSAVCTHPDWRGRGLGRILVEYISATIQQRDRIPFLHVYTTNTSAIRLYQELGFKISRTLHVTAIAHSVAKGSDD
jgi:ribosomal protein S18 acetylase RimI-like enzyme